METMPIVLDISSEEEHEDERESTIHSCWIKKFVDMGDEELRKLVVLVEVNDQEKEEDDCLVLDCDPENQLKCVNYSSNHSHDLLVLGEKGQIACRDYPHPRHLCANFPYSSTPHEKHCAQCHCYVCDSPSPCMKWGNGLSTTDHCHATDKTKTWKTLREDLKLGKTAPLATSNSNSVSTASHPLSVNLMLRNQASLPITMNQFESYAASNFTILNDGRCQESGSTLVRNNKYSPCSTIPRQFLGVHNPAIQKDRGHRVCSLGYQNTGFNVKAINSLLTQPRSAYNNRNQLHLNETGFLAKDSSLGENENTCENICNVDRLVSMNIQRNAKEESSTPFTGTTHLSLNDIKHWLLDSS